MLGYTPGRDIAATRHRTEGTSRRGFRGSHPRFPDGGRQTNPGCVNAFDLVGFRRRTTCRFWLSLSLSSQMFSFLEILPHCSLPIPGAFAFSVFTFAFRILVYLTPTGKWKLPGDDDFFLKKDDIFENWQQKYVSFLFNANNIFFNTGIFIFTLGRTLKWVSHYFLINR